MGIEDDGNMGFQHRSGDDSFLNCPSSSGADPFFGSGWDRLVTQSDNFGGSSGPGVPHSEFGNSPYSVVLENQALPSNSHLVQYPSDSGLFEIIPKLPCLGSRSFSEIVSFFGLPQCGQIASTGCPTNGAHSQGEQQISDGGTVGITSCGKRKKRLSPFNPSKNGEGEQHMDISGDSSEYPKVHNKKKQKIEKYATVNLRGKQTGKQAKDNSSGGEAPKENYIHMRARRGQSTNSHSLAERVRRERISERMKLLQELVPGCTKITGKAVMLDEIINYVQSLQQQVEFLSMKLATVNPELNIYVERILSKEGSGAAIPGFGRGMCPSHSYSLGFPQGEPGIPSTSPFHAIPQNVWDNELQTLLQMGFSSKPAISSLGPNAGPSKLEL